MTIPCKDCITLAMCKGRFNNDPKHPYTSSRLLISKCIILSNYLARGHYLKLREDIINFYLGNEEEGYYKLLLGNEGVL